MLPRRDLAVILRSIPYEDRHRIVTALTENHGQITAFARNSVQSRRFGGALDVFSASDWIFSERPGSELHQLGEAQIRRSYEGLRKDLRRLSLASAFSEFILRLAPRQESCPSLFRLHTNALATVEETPETSLERSILPLLIGYMAKLLQWSGNQPQIGGCLRCQAALHSIDDNQHLSCVIADAGWVCPICRTEATRHVQGRQGESFQNSSLRITARAMRDFQSSLSLPIRQVPGSAGATRDEHEELYHFVEALAAYHLPSFDRETVKSLRFLGLRSNLPPLTVNRQ